MQVAPSSGIRAPLAVRGWWSNIAWLLVLVQVGISAVWADMRLANRGRTDYVILTDVEASPAEQHAARDLARALKKATGAEFPVRTLEDKLPRRAILVGRGTRIEAQYPEASWEALGDEEILVIARGTRLLLSGGRPRGTLYAVSRFLQDQVGVRWWTPWAETIPSSPSLRLPEMSVRAKPAFEARDPFWHVAFDAGWAVRNFSNSQSARIPEDLGGCIQYRGFVHTFFSLVPPEKYFASHPEWFSLIQGKRTADRAQLCLTQPSLKDHVVAEVRRWLKESPEARIVSISQNDWHGACECGTCKELDGAEGSHSGTMLTFVNEIAQRLEVEFPRLAFDTLAYQYTRKPPKTVRPRPNVIVRLCSIECNFREPLSHSSNASFADDIRNWAKICDRLYVWDYTTDFAHYVQPHPNYYVLGPNLRFFHEHRVRGMFEQGAYQSYGSEMAEMRAWVLAQLMWKPYQDDRALISEFLTGYYGSEAAPSIRQYLDLMHVASSGWNLTCFSDTDTPFHKFPILAQAEALWQQAERAASRDSEKLRRVRLGHLPIRYVWLARWNQLKDQCKEVGAKWPLPESRKTVADEFLALTRGEADIPWTVVTHLNESGVKPEMFVAKLPAEWSKP